MELFDGQSKRRAAKTLRYLPLSSAFYSEVKLSGLNSANVFQNSHIYCSKGGKWFKRIDSVEQAFRLLIKVGVLRREVDGQGLTNRVRLTPLGREILHDSPDLTSQQAGFVDRIAVWFTQKLSI